MGGEPPGQTLLLHNEAQPLALGMAMQCKSHERKHHSEGDDERSEQPAARHKSLILAQVLGYYALGGTNRLLSNPRRCPSRSAPAPMHDETMSSM